MAKALTEESISNAKLLLAQDMRNEVSNRDFLANEVLDNVLRLIIGRIVERSEVALSNSKEIVAVIVENFIEKVLARQLPVLVVNSFIALKIYNSLLKVCENNVYIFVQSTDEKADSAKECDKFNEDQSKLLFKEVPEESVCANSISQIIFECISLIESIFSSLFSSAAKNLISESWKKNVNVRVSLNVKTETPMNCSSNLIKSEKEIERGAENKFRVKKSNKAKRNVINAITNALIKSCIKKTAKSIRCTAQASNDITRAILTKVIYTEIFDELTNSKRLLKPAIQPSSEIDQMKSADAINIAAELEERFMSEEEIAEKLDYLNMDLFRISSKVELMKTQTVEDKPELLSLYERMSKLCLKVARQNSVTFQLAVEPFAARAINSEGRDALQSDRPHSRGVRQTRRTPRTHCTHPQPLPRQSRVCGEECRGGGDRGRRGVRVRAIEECREMQWMQEIEDQFLTEREIDRMMEGVDSDFFDQLPVSFSCDDAATKHSLY
eukprot:TRINITY_DN13752_c0_g4_i2.p1 TRINITY_DN13752_c0_g4~~TRINITY_DN13752_c0_g4_i2.p1  ORF type:complete len:511 (-),score=62.94 TRINITY_DN13752_c0_g4_i2:99-1592(-)